MRGDEQAFDDAPTCQVRVTGGLGRLWWCGVPLHQISHSCQRVAGCRQVGVRFGVDRWPPPVRACANTTVPRLRDRPEPGGPGPATVGLVRGPPGCPPAAGPPPVAITLR